MTQKVKCNMCGWQGDEDGLEHIPDGFSVLGDRMWQDACPTCKTDEYLMDVEGGEVDGKRKRKAGVFTPRDRGRKDKLQ